MEQPGLDNRHRDKNGQIARKHGNTLISTLRETYGPRFAENCPGNAKLVDVLHLLDEPSLTTLVHSVHGHAGPAPVDGPLRSIASTVCPGAIRVIARRPPIAVSGGSRNTFCLLCFLITYFTEAPAAAPCHLKLAGDVF
jgi:hypothetical protein